MKPKLKFVLIASGSIIIVGLSGWYLSRHAIPVLQPKGVIGSKERYLIIFASALSLAIVMPVFGLLGYFGYKYREGNKKAKYTPELGGSKLAETIWWLVPTVLIVAVATLTWQSSYALDPYKPIIGNQKTLHVQVVALDWKWLFIYPDQKLASVNELTIPQNTPVDFEITSDSVMNSFWIPSLGGQMYAMPGMTTHLNLAADTLGTYSGSAANISGKGFADMDFKIHVIGTDLFPLWEQAMRVNTPDLSQTAYDQLAKPGVIATNDLHRYSGVETGLFDNVVMKYMMPMGSSGTAMQMHGMAM